MANITHKLPNLPVGKKFEKNMTAIVRKKYTERGLGNQIQVMIGTTVDFKKGTDLFIENVPVDLTTDFSGKDYTEMIKVPSNMQFRICGIEIKFGIRYGNACGRFQTPVLVIGIDATPFEIEKVYKSFMMAFQWKANEIINAGLTSYRQALSCL